jgi:hydrogenase-4 component F
LLRGAHPGPDRRGARRQRATYSATFGLGLAALLGLPPFSLFASEIGIARAGVAAGIGWAIAAALAFVLVAFGAILVHAQRMLLGDPPESAAPPRTAAAAAVPLVAGLVGCAVLGVSIWPIERLLHAAAAVVAEGRSR